MVAEFFLQAGWNVQGGPMTSAAEMALMVGRDWFDLVGLSMATEARVGQLTENIRAIRAASRNHAIGVMVGGPAFLAHPDLVDQVGADAMAANGDEATGHAEALLTRLRGDGVHQGPVPA
jgi:methanogenic corrinoid protein MtbC1